MNSQAGARLVLSQPGLASTGLAVVVIGMVAAAASMTFGVRAWLLLLLAPLTEEVVFRLGLQETLLRHGAGMVKSAGLTAMVIAVVHVLAWQTIQGWWVVLPALALGAIYAKTRRLAPCIAAHTAMNLCWLMGALPNWRWLVA